MTDSMLATDMDDAYDAVRAEPTEASEAVAAIADDTAAEFDPDMEMEPE